MQLRSYQQDCLDALAQAYLIDLKRRLLVVMATGLGKTRIFCELPRLFPGEQTLVIAHRKELIKQAAERMMAINPELRVGIEQADQRVRADADIVVASIQTLARKKRREKFLQRGFGLVVVDECHHFVQKGTYDDVLTDFGIFRDGGPKLLGVTATPYRSDGNSLANFVEEVTYEKNILSGIDDGWLSPIHAYSVQTETNLDGIKTRGGDFVESELSQRVNTEARNLGIVEAYLKLARGRRSTLVFAVDRKHGRDLMATFQAAHIDAKCVFGDTPKDERAATLKGFVEGRFPVLVNVAVLTEGVDLPPVDAVVLARPTKSALYVAQAVGRGTRLSPDTGKESCLVIDLVDATRHQLASSATVLGLPSNVNAKGEDLRTIRQALKGFSEEFPGVSLQTAGEITIEWLHNKRREIQELMRRAQTTVSSAAVNLFGARSDPDVQKLSKLSWTRMFDGSLRMRVPPGKGEQSSVTVGIRKDASDHYVVEHFDSTQFSFSAQPAKFVHEKEAIEFADGQIHRLYGDRLTLIREKARWHGEPATEKQTELIQKMGGLVLGGMTKGEAKHAIDKLLALRDMAWNGPPTSKQAYRLREMGYDPVNMTKRQASAIISKHYS